MVLDNLIATYLGLRPSQTIKNLNRKVTPLLLQEAALKNLQSKSLDSLFNSWRKYRFFHLIEDWAGTIYDQLTHQQYLTTWTDEIDSSV